MGGFELTYFVLPIVVLLVGALAGSVIERRHLASLARREELPGPILTDLRSPPAGVVIVDARLVSGEAVLGADRGKEFVSTLRNLVGGEVLSLQKLMTRARREARLRMVDEARAAGADFVLNVRFEMCEVGGKATDVICYGTAIRSAVNS
ncbi:MAG TPA: heavy metal-binding domain-containing protein [Acidimicrobiales bacterium]|nr:heavy metal-binding domain-containing protein [Acidimicrobiales bacterium]